MDIGNGGCSASVRTIQLVNNLGPEMRNVLILAMEPTSTLIDPKSTERSNWQGICTFSDGAAGVWISDEPGEGALGSGKIILLARRCDRADSMGLGNGLLSIWDRGTGTI